MCRCCLYVDVVGVWMLSGCSDMVSKGHAPCTMRSLQRILFCYLNFTEIIILSQNGGKSYHTHILRVLPDLMWWCLSSWSGWRQLVERRVYPEAVSL